MIHHVNSKICQAHIKVFLLNVIINKFWLNLDTSLQKEISRQEKAKIKSCSYIQLGVILHLPALVNNTIDTDSSPTLYVIQEGINCMPTTDYFFTSVKPAPIVVTPPPQSTSQQTNSAASSNPGSSFTTNPPLVARRNQSLPLYAN